MPKFIIKKEILSLKLYIVQYDKVLLEIWAGQCSMVCLYKEI